MTIEYPPIAKRMEAVKSWALWATGANVVWRDQIDGGRVREANEVWCVLRPTLITKIGTDETISIDVDNDTGDAQFPRQDIIVAQRKINFELRAMSRSQEHADSAWNALLNAHIKVYSKYGLATFLKPACLGLNDVGNIINMPNLRNFDLRIEDVALFNITLNTVISDMDAVAIGTWIEAVEIGTSGEGNVGPTDIKDAGGTSLPAPLQFTDEVLP